MQKNILQQGANMIKKTLVLIFSLGIVSSSHADLNSSWTVNTIYVIANQKQVNPFLVALYWGIPESIEWVIQHPESRSWLLNFCDRLYSSCNDAKFQYFDNTKIDRHWILSLQKKAYMLCNYKLENFLQSITGYYIAHHPGEAEGWMW